MFEFHIVTIFPELFEGFLEASLLGKAINKELIKVNLVNLRDFTKDRHMSVDDAPYGGGSGMVMRPGPILEVLDALPPSHRILMTPQGRPFSQAAARRLVDMPPIALFCGRYEGVDERVHRLFDEEISLGDFVLNGGEVAAMAVVETVSRLLPGVLGNASSTVEESFSDKTLEYPQYTRPDIIRGLSVPEVLLSGDHGRIARWRRMQSLLRTRERRPDLFEQLELSDNDRELLAKAESSKQK
ncbi:MAG: tRNA (guanosine(37)-N1)-methyltransferase TrmD [Proteobacteria bacterium]|nr:tRNA (guanosine(37)-N1)-methyltransferase TrmD [Pseudomonadota bacterium]